GCNYGGDIGEVRIYDRALSSNEVAAAYNTDTVGDGIPNWWRLHWFGSTTTNSRTCASCDYTAGSGIPNSWVYTYGLDPVDPNLASETNANPWAHGLTNLQVYQNPSVLIANNYSTVGDGIPDWWKVTYGFSLTDPTVAGADPNGDGLCNLVEYELGTDPLAPDLPIDMVVNGGAVYTPSLTIPILATTTNYPNIRVSTDPLMSNATVVAISNGLANYTLPDNGDGLYNLYLQYADAQGQPHSIVVDKPITLDRLPPVVYITSPASNAVLNQAFITLQAVAADPDPIQPDELRPLNIWINGQPFWNRIGTNISMERFPVPVGSNSLTVTIQAVDQAGNTNTASQTWPINLSTATNAPNLLSVNLSSSMLLPNVNSIWVEGTVDNDYALVNAIVYAGSGDVTTNSLTVSQNQYEGSVPLESGTNQLVLLASDAAGNASSNVFTLISGTDFSGAITNPVFGAFATAPSNYVSGYVSALYDAGLPTQTNVTSVTINGVAAVLGTNQDAYGNIPFWTTNAIPLGVPITGTIGGPGIPTDPPTLSPVQSQVYEVVAKSSTENWVVLFPDAPGLARGIGNLCGGSWVVNGLGNNCTTNEYDLTVGSDSANVNVYEKSRQANYTCASAPANDQTIWGAWGDFEYDYSYVENARGLSFGTELSYRFAETDSGVQALWPWPDITQASLTFRPPAQYTNDTTVILTFEGVNYTHPQNVVQDLSQIKYLGQSPVSNDASSVSYLITVNNSQTYTINQDSFQWPSFTTNSVERDYCCYYGYEPDSSTTVFITDTMHSLSWTNFHNHSPVHILWTNGVDVTGTSGNQIIVGQQVNLQATVDTPGIATSNFSWSVSGYAISNYIIASDFSSAQVLPLVQTNNPSVSFYWVSGGQQNVTCSVLLNNGSMVTSSAGFAVQRPQQTVSVALLQPTVDDNFYDPLQPAPAYLHLGDPGGTYGITFTRGGSSNLYGGSNNWSQVIVSTLRLFKLNNATCLQFNATNSLDQKNPYDSNPDTTWDAPGVPLLTDYTEVVASNNFCMWLVYMPPGTNSIAVPSVAVSWNWSGDAVQSSGVWSMNGAGLASVTADGPTNGFPAWTGVVTGSETSSPVSCPR
ncbi:MAG: hypothetical protein ABSD58_18735, partial [Verrucomicrobiia bacterium]